jgi:hypothetical protein
MKRLAGKAVRNENEVSQELNVSKILGVDVSGQPRIVQEFGQAVIDRIIERTENNKDVSGKAFKGYSESYIESEDFDEFGKSASDVNLTLTGDMLDSVDFLQSGDTVKVEVADSETGKAYGNISGIRGKSNKKKNPRDWFGVSAKDLNEIKAKFKDDVKRLKKDSPSEVVREDLFTADSFLDTQDTDDIFDSLLGDIFGEG